MVAVAPPAAPAKGEYAVVARGANSRIWQRVSYQTNQAGRVRAVTNSYTELGTGLCVQAADGTWTDAVPVIAPDNVLGGAAGTGARHQVHFALNANAAGRRGAIHLVANDGQVFDGPIFTG